MSTIDQRALWYAVGRRDAGDPVCPDGFVVYFRSVSTQSVTDAFEDYVNLTIVGERLSKGGNWSGFRRSVGVA